MGCMIFMVYKPSTKNPPLLKQHHTVLPDHSSADLI